MYSTCVERSVCVITALYLFTVYEQVMPPRHEYGRMGAVCHRSRGMGNEKVKNKCGNLCDSNNYRHVAISNVCSKIHVILYLCEDYLWTVDN